MAENLNLFTSTQEVIQEALGKLGYDEAMYDLLKEPLRLLTVRIPVKWMMALQKYLLVIVRSTLTQ